MTLSRLRRWIALGLVLAIVGGCATYYERNAQFHEYFRNGEIDRAASLLSQDSKAAKGNNRFLYFCEQGVVQQMLGNYEESNRFFEQAYEYSEDTRISLAGKSLALLTNPQVLPYVGEDFELVLINYYKAINYLRLKQYDNALVECRRINLRLNDIGDSYEFTKRNYRQDAFASVLMGLIFEATGDINNAFISYRNAYDTYVTVYRPAFGMEPPEQLKRDLLRTAALNGFSDELAYYQRELGMTYQPQATGGGELVFFWQNGLGPLKQEWGLTFAVQRGGGDRVLFVNDELGLSFPFMLSSEDNEGDSLGGLKVVRVAFPKYIARKPVYESAELVTGGVAHPLEPAEDIAAIAQASLGDRMVRELGTALLRLALKQAAEEYVSRKSEGWGTVISLLNAATESADTRNWQVLPAMIHYARVPLPEGQSTIELRTTSPAQGVETTMTFTETVRRGETVFNLYHSLASVPLPMDAYRR